MIHLRDVSKSYDSKTLVLRDIQLEVADRAFVALVGDSGSGKTTLLKSINRLIEPDAGTVEIGGAAAGSFAGHDLRRKIGYVFQGIGLFPHFTVAENIGITPRLLGWTGPAIAARVAELLDLVALPQAYAARMPAALSGGQQQRVAIARALAARPQIMLMDEPFGALDPVTRDTLGGEYRHIHEETGLTTVMVTHDVMEAVLLADRIAVMRHGTLVAYDVPHALLTEHPDAGVRSLMEMPRRQAERVQALIRERGRAGAGAPAGG
jgi:osmoprotectant transport system ATP-binding protein